MAKRWTDSVSGINESLSKVARILKRQIDRIEVKSQGTDLEAFDIGALDKYVNMLTNIDKCQRDNEAALAKKYAELDESELIKIIKTLAPSKLVEIGKTVDAESDETEIPTDVGEVS